VQTGGEFGEDAGPAGAVGEADWAAPFAATNKGMIKVRTKGRGSRRATDEPLASCGIMENLLGSDRKAALTLRIAIDWAGISILDHFPQENGP